MQTAIIHRNRVIATQEAIQKAANTGWLHSVRQDARERYVIATQDHVIATQEAIQKAANTGWLHSVRQDARARCGEDLSVLPQPDSVKPQLA
jgi:hypothetical protein